MSINGLAAVGGVFAVLVFWHFFADWVFQSHKEALAKAKDWKVRARHCAVYTLLFYPLFLVMGMNVWVGDICVSILFFSHFFIDTYIPVMLWAKHLRKAPQFADVVPPVTFTKEITSGETKVVANPPQPWNNHEVGRITITYPDDEAAFKAFFATPIGAILCITMDQFLHIAFLLPIAWMMVR
jgi:hypothetical protein